MEGTLLQGFILQAKEFPRRTALLLDDGDLHEISYGELAACAAAVAEKLRSKGFEAGGNVAISLERGIDLISSVLGVLWAGGAYVPVSIAQPMERREQIYQQADIHYCITSADSSAMEYKDCCNVCIDGYQKNMCEIVHFETAYIAEPEETAYIIFTSGSTGNPKGVEIQHGAAWNTIADVQKRFNVTKKDCALAVSAIDFDLSVFDVFGLLSVGGSLVLLEEDMKKEPKDWIYKINRYGVTIWNSVPALFEMLLYTLKDGEKLDSLRLALLSGDWVKPAIYNGICNHCINCRMIALGGATEASIWSNFFEVTEIKKEWNAIPYGRPLTNQKFRIVLDEKDVPTGEIGELWIGGAGLAKGYIGALELTQKSFVMNQGERWYRTGDLGYRQSDGVMIFMGRMDQQVKVNGFRIELGEVESKLAEQENVKTAIALVKKIQGTAMLVAALQLKDLPKATHREPVIEREEGLQSNAFGKEIKNTINNFICSVLEQQPIILEEQVPEGIKGTWNLWQHIRAAQSEKQRIAKTQQDVDDKDVLKKILKQRIPLYRRILRGVEPPYVLLDDEQLAPAKIIAHSEENIFALDFLAQKIGKQIEQRHNMDAPFVIGLLYGRQGELYLPLMKKLELYGLRIKIIYLESSDAMLREARETFRPCKVDIKYKKIKYPCINQEIAGSLDALVAVNGIHTFTNVRRGLSFLRMLLADNGQLYGVESTEMSPMGLITAAVLENAFQNYEESRRKAFSPMIKSEQWCDKLEDAGYENICGIDWERTKLFLFVAENRRRQLPKKSDMEEYCRTKLLSYMIPQMLCYTVEWPLTENGKVDRKRIVDWFEICDEETGIEPVTDTEKQVAKIWNELLFRQQIYQHQNFFELGGDSLLLTRMLALFRNHFGVQISMRQIFEQPTLAAVAKMIDQMMIETELEEGEL